MKHGSVNVESLFELVTRYPTKTMTRSPFSLKSAHLLMWSSPLLLIILVFTLTATSAPRVARLRRPTLFDVTGHHAGPELDDVHVPTTSVSTPVIVAAKTAATTTTILEEYVVTPTTASRA